MSRSGYVEDFIDPKYANTWRGAVASALRGKRGQSFLRELRAALDALPEPKRLVARELEKDGAVCALSSVGRARGLDMTAVDPEDYEQVAKAFDLSAALVREVEYINDDCYDDEARYRMVSGWVDRQLAAAPQGAKETK